MDYQMEKALQKCFRAVTDNYNGFVRIYGIPYSYRVVEGVPEKEAMLEVIDYTSADLLVRVNNNLFESDVNYVVGH